MNKFFVIFILVLVAGLGIAGFWFWQGNKYSKEILKLEILGPEEAQAGEEVEYLVKFKNNGNVRLEEAELIFEYPKYAIPEEGKSQRAMQTIGDIYPGDEKVITFKGRLFGKEQEALEAKAILTYKPKNLKAQYERKTDFVTRVKFVPLTFEFDLPLKVGQGEKLNFSLNYFSNINYVLENLRVKLVYPQGFTFAHSVPKALDETEWTLPSLSQADGGRIEIEGTLEGEEGKSKIFKAQLGMLNDDEFVLLKEATHTVELAEPSLYISQLINGSQNYVANVDEMLHYEIFFKNIGKKPIEKKFLFVKLEGEFFDISALKSEKGEIGRGDNSIVWDWKSVPELRFLDADQEGKVEFWVKTRPISAVTQKIKNPVLKNAITFGGAQKTFDIKINSVVDFAQKAYYQDEIFGNSGPIPPQAGEKTTYTVFWQIKNHWNDLENVKVKTTLSKNVSVTGKFFPEDAKFTFDLQSRQVVWNVGEIKAFKGFGEGEESSPLTLAFQIELTPEPSQRDQTPLLIDTAEVLGEDVFTSDIIQEKTEGVNTTLPDDETVNEQQGIVQ